MARKPEDQAFDDLLLDQEAERQDEEASMLNEGRERLAEAAVVAVGKVKKSRPSPKDKAKAVDAVMRAVLLTMAANANRNATMAERHAKERKQAAAKRGTGKLEIEPITTKRIQERQARLAKEREVQKKPVGDA